MGIIAFILFRKYSVFYSKANKSKLPPFPGALSAKGKTSGVGDHCLTLMDYHIY